jgi:isoleucyl-tRNA synthetase
MNSAVVRAEDLKYTDEGVREVLKTVIIPYWNAYSFFVTYANIDGVEPTGAPDQPENPLDRWVLSEAERLVAEVTAQLDAYEMQKAIDPIISFIDSLNNWYIRRSRRRFWKSENDGDKEQAYQTLYSVLMTLTTVAAPIIPFMTDEIYRNLRTAGLPESVHLRDYPVADESRRDVELERKMTITRQAVSLGRAIRTVHNLKIRQPLAALHVVTRDDEAWRILREMEDIIREELNVKEVVFRENEEELVEYTAKANFRELGPRLGNRMRAAATVIEGLAGAEIQQLMDGSTLSIEVDGEMVDITSESVLVQRQEKENLRVLNEGSLTVALDPELTESLIQEGLVRDLIRAVQNLRKERGFEVTDRIVLSVSGDDEIVAATRTFEDYLSGETLAARLEWETAAEAVVLEIGDHPVRVSIRKV